MCSRKQKGNRMGTNENPAVIATVEDLTQKLAVMREAQKQFATFSQEQVDSIFRAAAMAADKARIPLAKMAVEETGMGVIEDKVIKIGIGCPGHRCLSNQLLQRIFNHNQRGVGHRVCRLFLICVRSLSGA